MTHDDSPFHFSAPWFELGIITQARLEDFRREWAKGEDHCAEHYRWRAFNAFVKDHRPIAPETVVALYALGAADADEAMGEAMMHCLVELSGALSTW